LKNDLYEVWNWVVDQKLDSLENKQKAFELTTKHFKNKFNSNEIRLYFIKMGFFDENKE